MITKNQAKLIRKLKSRKRRDEEAVLVEGVRLVEALLASDLEIMLAVVSPSLEETPRGQRLRMLVSDRRLQVTEVSESEMQKLADTETPQGVLAVARQPRRLLAESRPQGDSCVVVLDRLSDPGNLGALARAADALGAAWIVALPGSVDLWSPKVVRAAAGSLFRLPSSQEPWWAVVSWLRKHEFAILCADPGGEPVPRAGSKIGRFALVLGNEPAGLSEEVRAECDRCVGISLPGGMDSLNVAVAGALLLDRLLAGRASGAPET